MERAKGFERSTPTIARMLRATRCVVRRNRERSLGAMTTWARRVSSREPGAREEPERAEDRDHGGHRIDRNGAARRRGVRGEAWRQHPVQREQRREDERYDRDLADFHSDIERGKRRQ